MRTFYEITFYYIHCNELYGISYNGKLPQFVTKILGQFYNVLVKNK